LIDSNPAATCGYMEFTGTGLTAVKTALDGLKREMAILGARILEEQKNVGEAAETIELRSQGDTATLSSIVNSVQEGLKQVLKYLCYWMNLPDSEIDKIDVTMNKDFISSKITPMEISALLAALQAGEISQDTFLYQLKIGEILPEDRTIEDEKELIDMDNDKRMKNDMSNYLGSFDTGLGGGSMGTLQEGLDQYGGG
jgi:hypothetical protein